MQIEQAGLRSLRANAALNRARFSPRYRPKFNAAANRRCGLIHKVAIQPLTAAGTGLVDRCHRFRYCRRLSTLFHPLDRFAQQPNQSKQFGTLSAGCLGALTVTIGTLRLPEGAPLPFAVPCIRQQDLPFTAGDRHDFPARVVAWQRLARRKCDGSRFIRRLDLIALIILLECTGLMFTFLVQPG